MTTPNHCSLVLAPRDGFFCKDGRGWFTTSNGRAHSLDWPLPPTLRGALCTAFGRLLETEMPQPLSPNQWLALRDEVRLGWTLPLRRPLLDSQWKTEHRMWPVPADALYIQHESNVFSLQPEPPSDGWTTLGMALESDDAGTRLEAAVREALWRPYPPSKSKPLTPPRWWCESEMIAWLTGNPVPVGESKQRAARGLTRRVNVHLSINAQTQTADDGKLFVTETLEAISGHPSQGPLHQWAVACMVTGPQKTHGKQPSHATLGRSRALAILHPLPDGWAKFPDALREAFTTKKIFGLRLFCVTPAHFSQSGWHPDEFKPHPQSNSYRGMLPKISSELCLRAACVARPIYHSGWEMAGAGAGERRTRQLVPPGSVFFVTKTSGEPFHLQEVEALWLDHFGDSISDGFGYFVPGIWNPPTHD